MLSQQFDRLCQLEPKLLDLEAYVQQLRRRRQSRIWQWCRLVKPKLCQLVGWAAQDEELARSEAYHIATQYLLGILEGRRRTPGSFVGLVGGQVDWLHCAGSASGFFEVDTC